MNGIQASPKRWWILAALAISLLAVGLDMTILNLAMPVLAADLNASTSQLQWFANAYNLILAAALLPAGMLGDKFGRKRILMVALALFGAASIVCAYADNATALIAGRAALGLGAALLMPASMSMLSVLFTEDERPRALRVWVTATFLGLPLGPILGGWLLDHYHWGSIFLINVPIILIGLIAVALLMPSVRNSERQRTDYIGILSSSAGLTTLTYGLTRSGEFGWEDPYTLLFIFAGLALLAVFIRWQRISAFPLIQLSLFREPRFMWGATLATLVNFAMFGVLFGLPLFFQAVNGVDSQMTGFRILPLIGGLVIGAQLAGKLAERIGAKAIVSLGFALLAAGLLLGGFTEVSTGYGYAALWITIVGVGIGFALPTAMDSALGALPPERNGVGSALTMAMRQVGGTIGVAFLGAILNASYHRGLNLDGLTSQEAELVRANVTSGIAVADRLHSSALLESVRAAYADGLDAMLWTCGSIALLGMLLTAIYWPHRKQIKETSKVAV